MAKIEVSEADTEDQVKPKKRGLKQRFGRLWSTKKGKALVIFIILLLVVGLMLAITPVRDATFGQFVKKDIQVRVIDAARGRPVSEAVVTVDKQEVTTDTEGIAKFETIRAIPQTIVVSKPNYKQASIKYVVPFFKKPAEQEVKLEATGQPVTITAIDAITDAPLADVVIGYGDATTKTDIEGKAVLVLPYDDKKQTGQAQKGGYVTKAMSLKTDRDQLELTAKLALAPVGTVMYLSNETGIINVMQANLDGSNPKVLVKGTGNEADYGTVLLPTRDWKYAALLARRDGRSDKLYLVDKSSGEFVLIDEGEVSFSLTGWTDYKFVYHINRENVKNWQPKKSALKVYDAEARSLRVVDETGAFADGSSYGYSSYAGVYILDNEVVYAKSWHFGDRYSYHYYGNETKNAQLMSINPGSYQVDIIKNLAQKDGDDLQSRLYKPQNVYLELTVDNNYENPTYYSYESGKIETIEDLNTSEFRKKPPTYLVSPSGNKTFWYDERNGKNTLFIGDKRGDGVKKIADGSLYEPYGWFGDNDQYVLVSKDDSELFVAAADMLSDKDYKPLKISNYHKPRFYSGYGYGGF